MSPRVSETDTHKKRKGVEKTVVRVRIEANVGKLKNEGMPLDAWSWRKYGQKPIKGSPYPRGYYRCSTSKGCSAKKQVEKCKTDASLLIITYISSHNHPINYQTKPGKHEQENNQFGYLKTSSKEMHMDCVSDEPVISSSCCSTSASKEYLEEENDFFDDLEELPMFSGFTTTMFGAMGFRSSHL